MYLWYLCHSCSFLSVMSTSYRLTRQSTDKHLYFLNVCPDSTFSSVCDFTCRSFSLIDKIPNRWTETTYKSRTDTFLPSDSRSVYPKRWFDVGVGNGGVRRRNEKGIAGSAKYLVMCRKWRRFIWCMDTRTSWADSCGRGACRRCGVVVSAGISAVAGGAGYRSAVCKPTDRVGDFVVKSFPQNEARTDLK